eukprot:scaffold12662_cov36-Phaeocystis_antarctica.AAC.1
MDGGRTYYYHTQKQETQWTMPVEFEVVQDGLHGQEENPPPPPPDDGTGGKMSGKRAKREQRRREQEAAGAEEQAAEEAAAAVERPLRAAVRAQAEGGEGAGQAFSEMLTE